MDYAKIQLVDTRSPRWRRASATARGAAISVLAYCADLENGGIIPDAKTWCSNDWLMLMATSISDVVEAVDCGLCEWRGDSLVCHLYDHDGHAALMTKRAQGPHGAKGGRPRNPVGNESGNPMGLQTVTHGETHAEKSNNPQKSPDQSSPDQKRPVQRGREASALALTSGSGQQPASLFPDKNDRQRQFIMNLGGEVVLNGRDLLPEWQKKFKGISQDRIKRVFETTRPAIRLPSNFSEAIKQQRETA